MLSFEEIMTQRFTQSVIRRKARYVAKRCGFTLRDLGDIEQELRLRLLQSLPRFNPEQSHINVFITMVVEHSMGMIIRERQAKKRNRTDIQSLDHPVDGIAAGEILAHDEKADPTDRADRSTDLQEVVEALPEDLRDLAERLMVKSTTDVARDLGVHRVTVLRRMRHLRREFENAGLEIYL